MITFDQTVISIFIGTGIFGINAGILGTFLVLQKKSLMSDAIAHATLPGLTIIFFIMMNKNPWLLLLGGTLSALIACACLYYLEKHTNLKKDAQLGIILATSFGLGTVMLSKIQTLPDAHQAGLTKYLLGNASTILQSEIIMIGMITLLTIICLLLIFKPYKIMLFDPEYSATIEIPTRIISTTILIITTLNIVVGLQTMGVILISALFIAPACAAAQWTNRYTTMIILAMTCSLFSTTAGTLISSALPHVPTGPTIAIIASCITLLSILISPNGILMTALHRIRKIKQMNALTMLSNFLLFNEGLSDPYHPHDLAALQALGKKGTNELLKHLEKDGLIESPQKNFWRLTPKGLKVLTTHKSSELS